MSDGTILRYRDVGSGPLILAVHGFPDTPHTWTDLSAALARAGYRVVAPALRGYAPSDIPERGDYSLHRLATDIRDLLDHLAVERAILIGHDWGASASYAMAAMWPGRIAALVALAIPPLAVFRNGLGERWARPHNLYLGLGALSDWWLRRAGFREVRRLYKRWSPHWPVPDRHLETVVSALEPRERSRAAVDYYRLGKTGQSAEDIAVPLSTPTLMIYGGDEPEPRKAAFTEAVNVTGPGSRAVMIERVGHWPHLEAPKRCLMEIRSFLAGTDALPRSTS